MEVISAVTEEEKQQIAAYLEKNCIQVRPAQSELTFDLLLTLRTAEHCVKLRIAENHTNIVLIEKDGVVLQRQDAAPSQPANLTDRSCLSVERILAFAEQVELETVEPADSAAAPDEPRHRGGRAAPRLGREHRLCAAAAQRRRREEPGKGDGRRRL